MPLEAVKFSESEGTVPLQLCPPGPAAEGASTALECHAASSPVSAEAAASNIGASSSITLRRSSSTKLASPRRAGRVTVMISCYDTRSPLQDMASIIEI